LLLLKKPAKAGFFYGCTLFFKYVLGLLTNKYMREQLLL